MKPLATLGEVMNDIDWRTQRRLAGVPSRPPPSDRAGRPDRGYVEQPEERVEPIVLKKRGLIPMAELERVQLEELAEELGEPSPFENTPRPPPERETRVFPGKPATQALTGLLSQLSLPPSQPPAPEPAEMPKAKQKRLYRGQDTIDRVVGLVIAAGYRPGHRDGHIARIAKEQDIEPSLVHRWVSNYVAKHGVKMPASVAPPVSAVTSTQTLMSTPTPPMSAPVSVSNGQLPPAPTVSLSGLEEYIEAIVKRAVASEFRRRLQGMAD